MKDDSIIALLADKTGMDYFENSDFLMEVAISARAKLVRQRMRSHGKITWMIDTFKVGLEIDEQDEYCSMFLCPILKSVKPIPSIIHTSSNLPFVGIFSASMENFKFISPMDFPLYRMDNRFKRYFFVNNYLYITGTLLLKEIQGQALFSSMYKDFSSCLCSKEKTLGQVPEEYIEELIRLAMCIIEAKPYTNRETQQEEQIKQ
jgi:hypothetical protein